MTITRREFLRRTAAGGAGLLFAVHLPELARAAGETEPFAPNAYLRIAPDDTVTIAVIRHEMGQGVRTLLPMMVAEELEADWSRVKLEQAVTGPRWKGIRLHTSGSGSSRGSYEAMRKAGASAREMLIAAAAERWGVDPAACRAENGQVVHAASGRKLTFGALAPEAAKRQPPADVKLKDPAQYKLIGKPIPRVDGPDIVTGRARYGLDVRVPGMVYASIERAPVLGAKRVRYDDARARQKPGVLQTVPVKRGIQQGVAVIATSTWAAVQGRSGLDIEWDLGRHQGFDSDRFADEVVAAVQNASYKVRHVGDAVAAMRGAAKTIEATYVYPFQAHAPLETMNCTADVRADSAEFWVPTQTQHRCMEAATRVTGLPEEKIRIHALLMGGAFGRRLFADYLAEAAEISKAIGKPVQVSWTREDDMRHGYFQPLNAQKMTGGLDASGKLVAWIHRCTASDLTIYDVHEGRDMYSAEPKAPKAAGHYEEDEWPWGAFDSPYEIANLRVDCADVPSPVPHGPWRAVSYPPTVFGRESFLDELAHAAGRDPLAFRLELLGGGTKQVGSYALDQDRMAQVHRTAAERAGWGTAPRSNDGRLRGRGIAASVYHGGSYIAQVAEVSVAKDLTDLRVERLVCAVDCGLVLHPSGLLGQAESGITWGLSAALHGKVDFKNGRAVPGGFSDFEVMRMREMPPNEIHIVPSTARPGGFGEHPVPMVAPAVANAVFAATGLRVRRLPITPESLQAAQAG